MAPAFFELGARVSVIRRTPTTVVQSVGDELLVHDTARDETFALAGAPAAALAAVNDQADLDALVDAHGAAAVAELVDHGLVEVDGLARRDLLKRAGLVGAVVASGAVVSVAAASPAFAVSGTPTATAASGTVLTNSAASRMASLAGNVMPAAGGSAAQITGSLSYILMSVTPAGGTAAFAPSATPNVTLGTAGATTLTVTAAGTYNLRATYNPATGSTFASSFDDFSVTF